MENKGSKIEKDLRIEKIKISDVATYKENVEINDLRKINFFYGSNGTGKTTISKIIASPNNYKNCEVKWRSDIKLKTLVYNDDFVRNYFYQSENFPGIYTMGEGAKDIEEEIKKKKDELDKIKEELINLNETIENKEKEKTQIQDNFNEVCWQSLYLKYQQNFTEVFKGYRNNKKNFADKILLEYKTNHAAVKDYGELLKEYNIIYNQTLNKLDEITKIEDTLINDVKLIEVDKILSTSIIGKENVDIGKLIHKLQNHDWVREGKNYLENSFIESEQKYICPFCQQRVDKDFKHKLEEYFDETYENQIKNLESLNDRYTGVKKALEEYYQKLSTIQNNQYFNEKKQETEEKFRLLFQIMSTNIEKLKEKKDKPSIVIELESILEILYEINEIFDGINREIHNHNNLIKNRKTEQERLESEIWHFFCNEISQYIDTYKTNTSNAEKALNSIEGKIEINDQKQVDINTDISTLEKKIKSIKPTVEVINKLLDHFGFKGFRLEALDDDKHYKIVREDGSPAKENLSEGERNFIIFLYFYNLIQGVLDPAENINDDKIVVFDDPVSSLDSDVLFIVSTLIKKLLKDIRDNNSNIKQAFILTHNVYFFKEVSYISSRKTYNKRKDTIYYIIRKKDNISGIVAYEENPIKSSYQLLWEEIKRKDVDKVCIQNAMRRIIEFYFKLLANLDEETLINNFENEEDKKICRSLVSWVNVGSHEIFDDINYSPNFEEIEKYKKVFQKIFEHTKQIEHFNMMMGIEKPVS
ncbi:conserved hypothetical protein [Petrotoga mobilis SJ95]|uniref:Protein CR006 P-loop domain-containing protein n=1 Tax=Petrotoga mobilis (strain DSM 10674 / SJ95) TaxID=403833 RepID=A9BGJ4_PETMO|nr:AAA family ATPase [Petrotoga mobilis]ABX32234.1 conserved hypothetical protein [Petrotoga mobilis SJ95]